MTAFDWRASVGLVVALVAGAVLAPGPWEDLGLLLVLPCYAILEGIRLRRPWLSGGLAAVVTLALVVAGWMAGRLKHVPYGPQDLYGVVMSALGMGGLGALAAWVSARLAQPLPATSLEQRAGDLMVPAAFQDLGLAEAARAAVGGWEGASGSPGWSGGGASGAAAGWLDARQRARAVEALLATLGRLALPRIGVTREEVYGRGAVRLFPAESCARCQGEGLIQCPGCRGEGRVLGDAGEGSAPSAEVACFGCGGHGTVVCECVDTVTYQLPAGAPSGSIVRGECGRSEHRHYATIHSGALPRPKRPLAVTLLGALGVPAGIFIAIFFGVVAYQEPAGRVASLLLAAGGALWALAAVPLLVRARWGWSVMRAALVVIISAGLVVLTASPAGVLGLLQEGLPVDLLGLVMFLLAVEVGLVALLRWWQTAPVTAHFGARDKLVQAVAPRLLPARDRLGRAITSRTARVVAWVVGASILGWLVLDVAAGFHWTMARGRLAASMGGTQSAIDLYTDAEVQARGRDEQRRATRSGNRERLRQIEDMLAESDSRRWDTSGGIGGADPAPSGAAYSIASACESLAERSDSLESGQKPRAAELVWACGDRLAEGKQWDESRRVLEALVSRFPESAPTREVETRSVWQLARVMQVESPGEIPMNPYPVVTDWGSVEWRHQSLRPASGNRLLVVTMELAHLGSSPKELLADRCSLLDDEGRACPAAGLPTQDTTDDGSEIHQLALSRQYPGISVGPDLCEAEVVFEVPENVKSFGLALKGERVARVTVPGGSH